MKTLHLAIILIVISLFVPLMLNNAANGCQLNPDWPGTPCYAIPGLNVTKEQMQKDWSGYYMYKGSQWMEMKRTEMINATTSGILKAWVCSNTSNYDAWQYYYLNGQAPPIAWPANGPMCAIPPLQQLKVGTKIGEVECSYNLYLFVNKEDGMPACIKAASIARLQNFGWLPLATYLDRSVAHSPNMAQIYLSEQEFACNLCTTKVENFTVIIGQNNTVKWMNNSTHPVWVRAIFYDDKAFFDSTNFPAGGRVGTIKFPSYMYPGQDFEYTFTTVGKFAWNTHPQLMGWITVLPKTSENQNDLGKITIENTTLSRK